MSPLQQVDLDTIEVPDTYTDTLTASQVAAIEGTATDFLAVLFAILTQIQRIIYGDAGGDWKADPATVFGGDASLKALYERGDWDRQDLLDNNTDYLVVGDTSVDSLVTVQYAFRLPIADRGIRGVFTFLQEGATVELGDDYWYTTPEVTGVTFSASIVGTEIRLGIVTSGVGENPTLLYRIDSAKE